MKLAVQTHRVVDVRVYGSTAVGCTVARYTLERCTRTWHWFCAFNHSSLFTLRLVFDDTRCVNTHHLCCCYTILPNIHCFEVYKHTSTLRTVWMGNVTAFSLLCITYAITQLNYSARNLSWYLWSYNFEKANKTFTFYEILLFARALESRIIKKSKSHLRQPVVSTIIFRHLPVFDFDFRPFFFVAMNV